MMLLVRCGRVRMTQAWVTSSIVFADSANHSPSKRKMPTDMVPLGATRLSDPTLDLSKSVHSWRYPDGTSFSNKLRPAAE